MYDLRTELDKLEIGDAFRIGRNERQSSMATLRKAVADFELKKLKVIRIEVEGEDWILRRVFSQKDKIMARKPKGVIAPEARLKTTVGAMLTPEQIAAGGSEHAHQAGLMQWVTMVWKHPLGHMLFAVPNGGDRQAHVGASMKAEGVKKGVPDLCWPVPRNCPSPDYPQMLLSDTGQQVYSGLWIEMKVPSRQNVKDGGCSPEQIKWHGDLIDQGYAVAVAYGWQAAAWVLELYSRGELRLPVVEGKVAVLRALACDKPPSKDQ